VEIRCWRFWSLSGDRTALLLYVLNGPSGYRWVFATSNTGLFGALLTAALLPFLLIAVGAAEARPFRRALE
jgi:hypothetical protein